METSDVIRIKRSELERYTKETAGEDAAMLEDAPRGALVDEGAASSNQAGAQDVNGALSLGHSVKSFTNSLHEKSSVMTGWLATVDSLVNGKPGEREVKWRCSWKTS